jgi:hypothetical protein
MRTLGVLFALLAGLSTSAEAETWNKSFPAGDHPRVHVITSDARVEVVARPGKTVDAHVELTGRVVGLYFGKVSPKVKLEQRPDGAIDIEARLVGSSAGIVVGSSQHLAVDVSVPPDCDLEIETSDGAIQVSGVRGKIDIGSSDGKVTLQEVRGEIRLHTSDGQVTAEGLDGQLTGTTSDGTMRVSGRFDNLELETSDGHLYVEVERGSRLADDWSLSTSDGGLDLTIPSEIKATLDARVRDGHLDLDHLPIRDFDDYSHHDVRLDLNGGGPVLRVRSGDGSVKIRGVS